MRTIARATVITALLALSAATGVTWASAAVAPTVPSINSTNAYGNPERYTPFWAPQQFGDCAEQSARLAMDAITDKDVASPAAIDREAYKLGITGATFDGSSFDLTNLALFAHYGFSAVFDFDGMSRATLQADLAKGDSIQVALDSDTIWAGHAIGNGKFDADHAVVVESVNKTTHAVTLGDTGGNLPGWNTAHETVPWSVFSKAWSASNYQAIVISR